LRPQKEQSVTILREPATRVATLLAAAGLCIAAGCAGRGPSSDGGINTGLAHVGKAESQPSAPIPVPPEVSAAEADLNRLAEESALNLQALFEQMNSGAAATEAKPSPVAAAEPAPAGPVLHAESALAEALREQTIAPPSEPAQAQKPVAVAPPAEDFPSEAPVAVNARVPDVTSTSPVAPARTGPIERPLQERVQETTLILVDLLRQHSMSTDTPMRTFLSLAAMEALWPGALQRIITPESLDGGGLTPDQTTAVETFRDLVVAARALGDPGGNETERLIAAAEKLMDSRPMRVRTAALCARVTGFGQYIPLSTTRFLHGRNHPVIIYTEVAPFAYREATSAEATRAGGGSASTSEYWAVELSQEVQIYHDVDGLLVWSRPEEVVVEVSRNRRRDFFVVNEIILPRTLSVGRYRMKVVMRDRTSGAMDEAVIPIEVVADPAIAAGLRD
jgi:hypothetical protein